MKKLVDHLKYWLVWSSTSLAAYLAGETPSWGAAREVSYQPKNIGCMGNAAWAATWKVQQARPCVTKLQPGRERVETNNAGKQKKQDKQFKQWEKKKQSQNNNKNCY